MTSCGQIEKLRWWGGCDAHNSHSAPPTSELYIQWVAYAMTVFVNCDPVRHAVRHAGPWSRVSDEAVRTPMYALNLRRGYRPTGGLMYALNLRRGYRPTGGLEEPFFRAERVAS